MIVSTCFNNTTGVSFWIPRTASCLWILELFMSFGAVYEFLSLSRSRSLSRERTTTFVDYRWKNRHKVGHCSSLNFQAWRSVKKYYAAWGTMSSFAVELHESRQWSRNCRLDCCGPHPRGEPAAIPRHWNADVDTVGPEDWTARSPGFGGAHLFGGRVTPDIPWLRYIDFSCFSFYVNHFQYIRITSGLVELVYRLDFPLEKASWSVFRQLLVLFLLLLELLMLESWNLRHLPMTLSGLSVFWHEILAVPSLKLLQLSTL